jgi:integrase
VFSGRDESGRPTQASRTVRGTKRDAIRIANGFDSRKPTRAAGRKVADVLTAWLEVNEATWSEASRRDNKSRVSQILTDPIAKIAIARLGVSDVERWHARMRRAGVGEAAVRGRHSALRAALAQAVRWEWLPMNVASAARLRQPRRAPRQGMDSAEVRAVIDVAGSLDPAAALALRLAAVAGLRRSELAAMRWDDLDGDRLRVDSSIEVVRRAGSRSYVRDAPTKTGNQRTVWLDPDTVRMIERLRGARGDESEYVFSRLAGPPKPDRIGWWWRRARELSGIDRKWRLHDLRHWTATIGIASGHDVRTVAGRIGHSNAAMTLRVYAHAVEDADHALGQTLGDALRSTTSDIVPPELL